MYIRIGGVPISWKKNDCKEISFRWLKISPIKWIFRLFITIKLNDTLFYKKK